MESLDNPSYFTLPAGSPTLSPCRAPLSLLKRRGAKMGAGPSSAGPSPSSSSSLLAQPRGSSSAPSTPTAPPPPPPTLSSGSAHRRSFRSLLRSVSANNPPHLLVLGEPRPCDVAPGVVEAAAARRAPPPAKSCSAELLGGGDMVYCGPAEQLSSSPEEVFLGREDARYYNLSAAAAAPQPGRRRHSVGTTCLARERRAEGDIAARMAAASVGDHASPGRARPAHSRKRCNRCCSSKDYFQGGWELQVPHRQRTRPTTQGPRDQTPPPTQDTIETQPNTLIQATDQHTARAERIPGGRVADMADILIVSSNQSQAAALWVSYLTTCFERFSNQHRKVLSVSLEEVVGDQPVPLALEEKMVHVKLQIVILCPQFLEHVFQNPGPGASLGKLLQPDRVLAMLLGVTEDHILEQHRAALMSYQQWRRLPVKDQDESFVSEFFEIATNMLARVWGQTVAHTEKAMFSLLPKKVKEGQNKVLVLLNEPISKEDKLKVSVDKNGERLAVAGVKRRNPYTLHFQMPPCCMEVSMLVTVYVEKNGEPLGCRQVKCESKMRELDQILRSWDNPLEFMCQTLGFSLADREHLDSFLVGALQRNLPPHFNLLHVPKGQPHCPASQASSPEEYPTLLHFAAKFGLEKLAWQLLECPGGDRACDVRNACELTPAEIAEAAGHTKLANALRGYMQMTELTSMYSYLKIMSEGNHETAVKDNNRETYQQPRPLNETYQVPPPIPRPVMETYQVPPAARPFIPSISTSMEDGADENLHGYMEMHPSAPLSHTATTLPEQLRPSLDFLSTVATHVASVPRPPSAATVSPRSPSPSAAAKPSGKSDGRRHLDEMSVCSSHSEEESRSPDTKKSHDQLSQGAQDELLEIINDFKDNVLTISEVEKLVERWQNRNDVQQSFKDKQMQLNQMREEYERIQREMNDSLKKPSPFDRIRYFFKGKPKASAGEVPPPCPGDEVKVTGVDTVPLCLRPVSSLSLQSTCSSSSGRTSTLSGCSGISLGDSGTHSDTDERKQMLAVTYERGRLGKGGGISNYEIPPAPRPLFPANHHAQNGTSSPANMAKHLPSSPEVQTESRPQHIDIQERPPQPIPRPDVLQDCDCENYISFADGDDAAEGKVTKQEERNIVQDNCYSEYLTLLSDDNACSDAAVSCVGEGKLASSVNAGNQTAAHEPSNCKTVPTVCRTDSPSCNAESAGGNCLLTNGQVSSPLLPCLDIASPELPEYMNMRVPATENNKAVPPVPPRLSSTKNA